MLPGSIYAKFCSKALLSLAASGLLLAESSFAEGFTVSPAITLERLTESDKPSGENEGTSTDLYFNLNLGLGYTMSNNLYVGAKVLYHKFNSESKSPTGNKDDFDTTLMGYGPTIGYAADSGWNVYFTYLLSADASGEGTVSVGAVSNTVEMKQEKSNGYMLEMGYAFAVNKSIGIGPQLVYLSRTYKQRSSSTLGAETVTEGTFTSSSIQPYIGFWFTF